MRQLSAMAAVVAFFVLAAIGLLHGVPVWACSTRSIAGAFVLYVTLQLAARLTVAVLASAAVRGTDSADTARSDGGGRK
ncbi:MAG: hypothetical protein NTV86_21615 [Planctomycetota bacterium]|nr:hypothetical protein [Planctomycetota bacterium]